MLRDRQQLEIKRKMSHEAHDPYRLYLRRSYKEIRARKQDQRLTELVAFAIYTLEETKLQGFRDPSTFRLRKISIVSYRFSMTRGEHTKFCGQPELYYTIAWSSLLMLLIIYERRGVYHDVDLADDLIIFTIYIFLFFFFPFFDRC